MGAMETIYCSLLDRINGALVLLLFGLFLMRSGGLVSQELFVTEALPGVGQCRNPREEAESRNLIL